MDSNGDDSDALKKVEDVSECIKQLATSTNPAALNAADKLLKHLEGEEVLKTKTDRTLINKCSTNGESTGSGSGVAAPETATSDAFLREIERDAAERAERRERNRKRANEWKERGNGHFKLANYEKAVECYTQGLSIAKDYELLYQNRANCYVKQGRYQEALSDAEAAIFLTKEKCAKPFFHQAKALAGLNRLDEAREAYRRMSACPDAVAGHAERCLAELDRQDAARSDEARALAEFQAAAPGDGIATVDGLVVRLARADRPAAYYAAGMRCLAGLLDSGSARALFRAKSGFSLLAKQKLVVAAMETPLPQMDEEQAGLVCSALSLCAAAATADAENAHRVLQLPGFPSRAIEAVAAASSAAALREAALDALLAVCRLACDRLCERPGFDPTVLLIGLAGQVQRPAGPALSAARLLTVLADCQRLRDRLDRSPSARLSALSSAGLEPLVTAGSAESLAAFAAAVESLRRLLAASRTARQAAAGRTACLAACEAALKRYAPDLKDCDEPADQLQQSAAAAVAGLLACLALEATPAVADRATTLADLALRLAGAGLGGGAGGGGGSDAETRQFSLALLATLAARVDSVARRVGSNPDALRLLSRVLACPGHPDAGSALRCLAAALAAEPEARRTVGDDPRWLELLLELLHSPSDALLGNAALCLGRAAAEDTSAAELLARTDVVRLLLCRMRDCREREAKANCAILCGRLAQMHHQHLGRLRELDGVNILNSVLTVNNIRL